MAHIGIAVPDIEEARSIYEALGYMAQGKIIAVPQQGVKTLMMQNGETNIELLAPLEKGVPSPVDSYIAAKPFKMYHLAYYVSDFEAAIETLKSHRFVMVDEPQSSETQDGRQTVFLFHRKAGIIELIEESV